MVMNNNDDTFIREVNEELRSEQLQNAWKRFRPVIIAVAVLIVLGVAGSALFEWWQARDVAGLDGPERDYWRIEDEDGRRFWLFREAHAAGPRWYLHGLFA